MSDERLPIHGFVLAGGRSSRMGQDKALLPFCGAPLVELAVAKLRSFCVDVSIAGSRRDLSGFAPVIEEPRLNFGPTAGLEAGLLAATQPWAMFIPVDVPLVPSTLLRCWAAATLASDAEGDALRMSAPLLGSSLMSAEGNQPAFCMVHQNVLPTVCRALDGGERRLTGVFEAVRQDHGAAAFEYFPVSDCVAAEEHARLRREFWFSNINTPQELAEAEAWARAEGWQAPATC